MTGESGQREIVLGNKQLLSIFFVAVAMMGVAFTIGYMLGRNRDSGGASTTARQSPVTVAATSTDDNRPAARIEAPIPDVRKPAALAATSESRVPETRATKPAADAVVDPPSDAQKTADARATGSYLQVAALKRPDADHFVQVLRTRGYTALLGESPKPGVFRVLVGPFQDTPTLADSKAKLKAAGFDAIIAK